MRAESDWSTGFCCVTHTAENISAAWYHGARARVYISTYVHARQPRAQRSHGVSVDRLRSRERYSCRFTKLGYREVRSEQLEAVREFIKDKDVFVSLPTGSGKSLCYGCLPLVYDYLRKNDSKTKSVVLVISPLRALMLDQVKSLSAKGVDSVYVTVEKLGTSTRL